MDTADHLELLAIAPRYAAAVDARDLTAAAALFAPDAMLVVPNPPREMSPVLANVGHEAIAEALGQVTSVELTVHEIVGQVIDAGATPDEAHGHVRCVAHHVSGEQDVVWHLHYKDTYVRLATGWRIARRELHLDVVEIRRVRPREIVSARED